MEIREKIAEKLNELSGLREKYGEMTIDTLIIQLEALSTYAKPEDKPIPNVGLRTPDIQLSAGEKCSCKTDIKNRTIEITDCPIHDKPEPLKRIEELKLGELWHIDELAEKINEIIKQINGGKA